jgi:hypothetical protein
MLLSLLYFAVCRLWSGPLRELDEHYCSLAIARWEAFSSERARKL